jgi:hypothetical protein
MLPEKPEADAEPRLDRRRLRGDVDAGLVSGNTACSRIQTDSHAGVSGQGTPDRHVSVLAPQEQEGIRTGSREGRGGMNVDMFLEPFE